MYDAIKVTLIKINMERVYLSYQNINFFSQIKGDLLLT